jgi:predicted component of type VI protein secretion system
VVHGRAFELSHIGPTPQAAIRTLLDLFRARGWRDHGAALAVVRALEEAGGVLSVSAAVRAMPSIFFARNALRRADAERALSELVSSHA